MGYTKTCNTGKRRYTSQKEADKVLDRIWRFAIKGTNKSEKIPCRVYACPRCKGYHLTSQPIRTEI